MSSKAENGYAANVRRTVFHPVWLASLRETEDWLDGMAEKGLVPAKLILGCIWRFEECGESALERYWYTDIKADPQGLFGQDKLAVLPEKLSKVFISEPVKAVLTKKRPLALTSKPNPNYRLEQFAVEEKQFYYKGDRLIQHMTPTRMLGIIKNKRTEALLTRCRASFIAWLLAFVLICCLLVWYKGFGWHLLLMIPIWGVMLVYAISFIRLAAESKRVNK